VTVVQTLGGLEDLQPNWLPSHLYGSISLYSDYTADYATMYRTQPNVRTCVDFIARNIAQLGLHVFRRVSDTDRQRLADHGLAKLIGRPNTFTTRYRLIEGLLSDMGIYFRAYWLKIKATGGGIALLRIPPALVTVEGGLMPTKYTISVGGSPVEIQPEQIVHFRGHNPDSSLDGLSPLETLRRILAEEAASGDYREGFWKNSARMSGIIERPLAAPEWSDTAMTRFTSQFKAMYSGSSNSGETAVLEEGMTYKPMTFSARDAEYLAGRQLTREECARSYHIPLPMVGILDHATFSNIEAQHRQLYQDSIGPWLEMIQEEIELQLLPEFTDSDNVYVEFNIAEKLKGSFEEQAAALSTMVGRPVMTANEGRARLNLPQIEGDADELVTPLNVLVGGQASPRDSAPPVTASAPKALPYAGKRTIDTTYTRLRSRHVEKWGQVLSKFFEHQGAVVEKLYRNATKAAPRASELWDADRWDSELGDDIYTLNGATAEAFGRRVADAIDFDEFDPDEMLPYLKENARIASEGINKTTLARLKAALSEDDPLEAIVHLFEVAAASRAAQIAQSKVTSAANFGSHRAAEQGGAAEKTWNVNSGNPRSQHATVDGETVKMSENFSNGLRWPGDGQSGDAEQLANCQCSVQFSVGRS
jgi:HK97 family phage portal protein